MVGVMRPIPKLLFSTEWLAKTVPEWQWLLAWYFDRPSHLLSLLHLQIQAYHLFDFISWSALVADPRKLIFIFYINGEHRAKTKFFPTRIRSAPVFKIAKDEADSSVFPSPARSSRFCYVAQVVDETLTWIEHSACCVQFMFLSTLHTLFLDFLLIHS